jgi:sRNA-binding protein
MRAHLALALLTAGLAACGPVAYVNEVTRRASDAVQEARIAEADKNAPYWWTRATEYLHKARENAARADFQGANRFGRLATEAAQKAIVEGKDPSKRPIDPNAPEGGGVAPAKDAKDPGGAAPAKDAKDPAGVAPAKDAP